MMTTPLDEAAQLATDRTCDEFDCADCGRHIYSLPAIDPAPTICGGCLWLREFAPDDPELRRRMTE